jgi:hypothetical protein
MAALSVLHDGMFVGCANPIFPISESEGSLIFEVLENDAALLKRRLGKIDEYCLNAGKPFSGKLESLEICQSTHQGLAYLRHKATMRAVMTIRKAQADVKQ